MLISGKTAKSREIPIVLDPVGVGISKFRTSAVHKIITEVKPDIVRLNASELKSICLNIKNMSGVDAVNIDSLDDTVELAKKLSIKTNAIIGVSGISDIVKRLSRLTNIPREERTRNDEKNYRLRLYAFICYRCICRRKSE